MHAAAYLRLAAGGAVRALGPEARLTLCNLSIEMGAKVGMVAPDDRTFEYLAGRRFAPQGALFELVHRGGHGPPVVVRSQGAAGAGRSKSSPKWRSALRTGLVKVPNSE